jgi:hypothetical protein
MFQMNNIKYELTTSKSFDEADGRVAVIEWQKVESEFGPPVEHRLCEEQAQNLLQI